jgi:hypothetical protein
MLSSTKRRMSVLERSIQIPITAEIFVARVQERARLTGASFEEAFSVADTFTYHLGLGERRRRVYATDLWRRHGGEE